MNRRNFLSLFSAGIAGIALEQAIPLGRVWSFPKEIVIPRFPVMPLHVEDWFEKGFPVGTTLHFRMPGRFPAFDYSYAAIRANGWHFPTAAFPPDSSHTPS
jgi:hypothetical protein